MARTVSIEKKLERHVAALEAKVGELQQQLEAARKNHENYITHKQVIESILGLQEVPEIPKPKRKYTRRAKAEV